MYSLVKKIGNLLVDFIFPKSKEIIALETFSPSHLLETLPRAHELSNSHIITLFDYSDPRVKNAIWELKYRGSKSLANTLGGILFDVIQDEINERHLFSSSSWHTEQVAILPIPTTPKKKFERGWNQAELLVKAIEANDAGKLFSYPQEILTKIRDTGSQVETASKSARLQNVKDSMRAELREKQRFIIVIDDVTTTGATFTEATRALKSAGAHKILCFAVAH